MSENQTEEAVEGNSDVAEEASQSSRPSRRERLEQEGDIAADYLEELLEIADLDGDLDMDVEGDRATVSIVGAPGTDGKVTGDDDADAGPVPAALVAVAVKV